MMLEAKVKALKAPLDEWNRAFQLLCDEHVLKLEQISACFDALVQRTQMVADQVEA